MQRCRNVLASPWFWSFTKAGKTTACSSACKWCRNARQARNSQRTASKCQVHQSRRYWHERQCIRLRHGTNRSEAEITSGQPGSRRTAHSAKSSGPSPYRSTREPARRGPEPLSCHLFPGCSPEPFGREPISFSCQVLKHVFDFRFAYAVGESA